MNRFFTVGFWAVLISTSFLVLGILVENRSVEHFVDNYFPNPLGLFMVGVVLSTVSLFHKSPRDKLLGVAGLLISIGSVAYFLAHFNLNIG